MEGAKLEAGRAVRRLVMIKVKDTGPEPPKLWVVVMRIAEGKFDKYLRD